jgi:hypothetical protein
MGKNKPNGIELPLDQLPTRPIEPTPSTVVDGEFDASRKRMLARMNEPDAIAASNSITDDETT